MNYEFWPTFLNLCSGNEKNEFGEQNFKEFKNE